MIFTQRWWTFFFAWFLWWQRYWFIAKKWTAATTYGVVSGVSGAHHPAPTINLVENVSFKAVIRQHILRERGARLIGCALARSNGGCSLSARGCLHVCGVYILQACARVLQNATAGCCAGGLSAPVRRHSSRLNCALPSVLRCSLFSHANFEIK